MVFTKAAPTVRLDSNDRYSLVCASAGDDSDRGRHLFQKCIRADSS